VQSARQIHYPNKGRGTHENKWQTMSSKDPANSFFFLCFGFVVVNSIQKISMKKVSALRHLFNQ